MKAQRVFGIVIVSLPMLLSIGCDKKAIPPGGISTILTGEWLLEKIVTPSGTTFPNGYYQTLEVGNDSRDNFISIRRNNQEIVREFEVRSGGYENEKDFTVNLRYRNGKMLRFFLIRTAEKNVPQGVKEMQVTEFMKEYSDEADTVRYFYRR